MAERVHVRSIAALESFRASLLVYLGKARPVLEETCDEVSRTRQWLQSDRRLHWENQVRRRAKALEQAQQTVFGAGLSNLREPTMAEKAAVHRAKRALAEAEAKLKLVKRWSLEFDNRVEPLVKQLEFLRTVLNNDMPKAVAYLAQTIKTLDAYAGLAPARPAPPIPSGDAESATAGDHSRDQPQAAASDADPAPLPNESNS